MPCCHPVGVPILQASVEAAAGAAGDPATASAGTPWVWLAFGFAGQALFTSRFLVQWLASERAGRSVVPVSFWWLSIGGAAILLTYAIYRVDPVFIVGQCMGMFIYTRNLALIRREHAGPAPEAGSPKTE